MTQAHNYGESFRLDGKVALITGAELVIDGGLTAM